MSLLLIFLLFIAYSLLNFFFPGPILTYALGGLIALISLVLVNQSGIRLINFFQMTSLSKKGLILLLIPLAYIPIAFLLGRIQPILPSDIWFGLASGISQEIFFRYSLITILSKFFPKNFSFVIFIQALLFGLWHSRAFITVSFWPALTVVIGSTLVGILWGTQSRKDKTIFYTALEHSLFLIIQ